ncbi:MAG: protein kinase [Planctomycetes bacterium]|nr:protein kinase [Planctomycetota bacterium]
MTLPEDEAEKREAELRRRFLAGVPERLQKIEEARAAATTSGSADDWKTFQRLVHNLKGAGATYGAGALSRAAERLELVLDAVRDSLYDPAFELPTSEIVSRLSEIGAAARAVTLPREAKTGPVPEPARPSSRPMPGPGRVLLIEDDEDLARSMTRLLLGAGLSCAWCPDGESAIASAKVRPPDVVLLDVVLPGMDGFEVCRRLRELPRLSRVPIVFLTAVGQESEILRAYDLGAEDYVTKPASPPVLLAKIRGMLERRQRREPRRPDRLTEGEVVAGRYRIQEPVGQGGMGAVYLARHLETGTLVALKALFLPDARRDEARERFRREIEALSELRHPNLVRILDHGEEEISFFAMEYLAGGSLSERVRERGALPAVEALGVLARIAEGLDVAHGLGFLHRDLKSDNVLFRADGEPVLTDFSLVLRLRDPQARLTETGRAFGTPWYMSPEQIRGRQDLDARSDVYGLGAMLYELLTGAPPYHDLPEAEALAKVLSDEAPEPGAVRGDIPLAAEIVCLRAMARDREARYQDAAAFARAAFQAIRELT